MSVLDSIRRSRVMGNPDPRPHCYILPPNRVGREMVAVRKENRKELLPWLVGEYRPLPESLPNLGLSTLNTSLVSLGPKISLPGSCALLLGFLLLFLFHVLRRKTEINIRSFIKAMAGCFPAGSLPAAWSRC